MMTKTNDPKAPVYIVVNIKFYDLNFLLVYCQASTQNLVITVIPIT